MNHSDDLKKLTEENHELREELQLKSDFLSVMIHQLRTPLSATKWIFKMMMDGDLGIVSEEQSTIIKRGFESNEQMIRMLAEISQANHLNTWKMEFELVPTDITECIANTLGAFTGEAKLKNIKLVYHKNHDTPLVMADKEKICLVVQNLIENGLKYNKHDGSLVIRTETLNNQLVISFTDTGIGIPIESQKNIFSKFYRAKNAKQTDKGTGLGLFVGKEIIESHHGSLWFESTINIGSTFFFSLPLAK